MLCDYYRLFGEFSELYMGCSARRLTQNDYYHENEC